jgi:stage V sporulation protein B
MKKFANAFLWLTASEIFFNIAAYVVHAVIGRVLGPADYGRYGLVVTLTTMVIVLIGNGIPTAMAKYVSEKIEANPDDIRSIKRQAAKLQMLVIGSITILFFFLSPVIAWLLRDPSLTPLFQLSSLVIPAFAAASFYHHYFTGLHLFKLQAIVKIVRSIARVGFIICAALLFGVEGSIGGYVLAPLFTFLAAIAIDEFYVKRKLGIGRKLDGHTFHFPMKTIAAYAGPLTLFLIFYELLLTLDLYFVKALLHDDHLTGLYNAAITVGRIPYYLFYALAMILLPAISKSTFEAKEEETEALIQKSLRFLLLLLTPMVTLLTIFATPALQFFFGNKYLEAAPAMQIFTIGVGFLTVFYVLAFAFNGAGKVKIPMNIALVGLIAFIPLNLFFIPKWGIVGASTAMAIVSCILMIGILFSVRKHFGVSLPLLSILRVFISVIILIPIASILPHGHFSFLFSGATLFILYLTSIHVLGELTTEDTDPIRKLFRKTEKKTAL